MDRSIFQLPFSSTRVPKWQCPTCRAGHLVLVPNSLQHRETPTSKREHDHDAWEPYWIKYVFSCLLECANADCREVISSCGTGSVDVFEHDDEEQGWVQETDDLFTPKYFDPPLILMDVPTRCPTEACTHLIDSFSLFFADPGASLNCARAAVEAVLTQLRVKRFTVVKGKRKSISLHHRIQLLPPKYKEQSELLLAVKWLGNAGSHDGVQPSQGDVRVAYDLLEHVLSEIYEKKANKLKAIAKKVNKKKGPIK